MLLELKKLEAGYGEHLVLKDVSLVAATGEMVALIGPNGAGKSTVLRSIMGLTRITGGEILLQGKPATHLPTHALLKEGVGFVPQGRLVFSSLTVLENLEMGGYLLNSSETLKRNISHVYERFPVLERKARAKAGSLSGGEQQMLAIGRALMMQPALLMLDEPSLGLSPKVVHEVFEKLQEINAAGITVLVVEQNVRLVLRYATRGYLMSAGKVRFEGSAEELQDEKRMHEAYLL